MKSEKHGGSLRPVSKKQLSFENKRKLKRKVSKKASKNTENSTKRTKCERDMNVQKGENINFVQFSVKNT